MPFELLQLFLQHKYNRTTIYKRTFVCFFGLSSDTVICFPSIITWPQSVSSSSSSSESVTVEFFCGFCFCCRHSSSTHRTILGSFCLCQWYFITMCNHEAKKNQISVWNIKAVANPAPPLRKHKGKVSGFSFCFGVVPLFNSKVHIMCSESGQLHSQSLGETLVSPPVSFSLDFV